MVTPVATCTVHCVSAASGAVFAVRVSDDALPPVSKAVKPHPVRVAEPGVTTANCGSTIVMTSFTARSAFKANKNVTPDAAPVTGFASVSVLTINRVGSAVETAIADVAMSDDADRLTATVRSTQSATWAVAGAVTPVLMLTVHATFAESGLSFAVSVMLAPALSEAEGVAVNVVLPHPVVVALDKMPNMKFGITSVI